MFVVQERLRKKRSGLSNHGIFRNEDGAIDLASTMVGVIVIGLIGGVIAATVFAVIPWSQDNAAKQQLNSVVQAENAYFGLSASVPSSLPTGYTVNSFTDSAGLANANLLRTGTTYCAVISNGGKNYQGYSSSASGTVWSVTDQNSNPVSFTGTLPSTLPSTCQFINTSVTAPSFTPTQTVMTFNCDTAVVSGTPPYSGNLNGTETWSDGSSSPTYTGASLPVVRSFAAHVNYTVTFTGTYTTINSQLNSNTIAAAPCLRSVDYWGLNSGVTSAK